MVSYVHRLWRTRGGAIIPLFALSALALIAVGGAAVDMARFYLVRDKAQAALDKTLLAASSATSVEDRDFTLNYFASGVFRANFPDTYFGVARPTPSITFGVRDLEGSVDISVPAYFTSLYGLDYLQTTVTSSFRQADPRHMEIVLVVERSNSFNVRSPADGGGAAYSPCTTTLANNFTLNSSCRRTLFEDVQDGLVAFVQDVFDSFDQTRIDAEKIRMGVVFYNDNVAFYERQAWRLFRQSYANFRFFYTNRRYPVPGGDYRNRHIFATTCFFARPRNNPQIAATNSTGTSRQVDRRWDDLLDVNDVPLWTTGAHMVPMAHYRKNRDRAIYAQTFEEARFSDALVPYYLYEWNCLEKWTYPDPADTSSPWAHLDRNSPLYSPSLALEKDEKIITDTIEMASPHGGAALAEGLAWGLRMLSPRWSQHWLMRVTQSTQSVTQARGNASWYRGYAPPYDENDRSIKILILVGTGQSQFPLESRGQWATTNTSAGLAAPDMPINYASSPLGSNFARLDTYLEAGSGNNFHARDFINLTENNYTNTLSSGRYKGTVHAYGWSNFGPCMGHRPPIRNGVTAGNQFHYLDYDTVEQHCFNSNATGCPTASGGTDLRSITLACYRHVALMSPTTDLTANRDNDILASRDSSSNKRVQDELEARAYADVCPYLESRDVLVFTIGVVTTGTGDMDTRRNAVNERIRRCVAQEHWNERTFTAINEQELIDAFTDIRSFLITPRFVE